MPVLLLLLTLTALLVLLSLSLIETSLFVLFIILLSLFLRFLSCFFPKLDKLSMDLRFELRCFNSFLSSDAIFSSPGLSLLLSIGFKIPSLT